MLKRLAVATAVVAALAGLAACGSSDNTKTDTGSKSAAQDAGSHNDADVTFATSMIPHHQQALEMVDLTDGRTLDPAVRQLADQIKAAQAPEIETMSGWLTDWGKPVPSATATGADSHDMGGMDMGSQEMPGMMSAEDMADLKNDTSADFQDMWLQMMVRHHEGAIAMAKTELEDGKYEAAKELAQSVIDGQQAEIDQMKQLLGS
jgi:uncharacterized protein (DUF305 family)